MVYTIPKMEQNNQTNASIIDGLNEKKLQLINQIKVLPEVLYVETRFVTKQFPKNQKPESNSSISLLQTTPTMSFLPITTPLPSKTIPSTMLPFRNTSISLAPSSTLHSNPQTTPLSISSPIISRIPNSSSLAIPTTSVLRMPTHPSVQSKSITTTTSSLSIVTGPINTVARSSATKISTIPIKLPLNKTTVQRIARSIPKLTNGKDFQQQTDKAPTTSIGIQCNINDDFDEDNDESRMEIISIDLCDELSPTNSDEFAQFKSKNSHKYNNGKIECLLCGEVSANSKKLHSHMSEHWGIEVLCFKCGRRFENETKLNLHKCDRSRLPKFVMKKNQQLYRCPKFNCAVNAISKFELYDHINEHMRTHAYKCVKCKSKYKTLGELRHHNVTHLKRLEKFTLYKSPYRLNSKFDAIYRKRIRYVYSIKYGRIVVKTSLSKGPQIKNNRFCTICRKYCPNNLQYRTHRRRCLRAYKIRLETKRKLYDILVETNIDY